MASHKIPIGNINEVQVIHFLEAVLKEHGGVLLGETHNSRAQFKVLVDLIGHCKGDSPALLVEYFKEEQQKELDKFFSSKEDLETGHWVLFKYFLGRSVMNHAMVEEGYNLSHENKGAFLESFETYMENIYKKHLTVKEAVKDGVITEKHEEPYSLIERLTEMEKSQPYNLLQLLEACKVHKVRVVAVDSEEARTVKTLDDRHEVLNATVAKHIIAKQKTDGAFIVCVGAKHTRDHKRQDGKGLVAGLQATTNLPDIFVTDNTDAKHMQLDKNNGKPFVLGNIEVYSDYVLVVPEEYCHHAYDKSHRKKISDKQSIQYQKKEDSGCCIIS